MKRLLAGAATAVAATALVLSISAPSSVSAATATTTVAAKAAQGGQQGGPGAGARRGGPFGGTNTLDAAAKAIGVTTDELQKQLAAGKSIADVAATKKVSSDKVVDAIQAAMRPQIVEMVNAKGGGFMMRGPGGPNDQGGQAGSGSTGSGEALKTCLKSKGVDPTKTPTDEAGKAARAKALKECIKSA